MVLYYFQSPQAESYTVEHSEFLLLAVNNELSFHSVLRSVLHTLSHEIITAALQGKHYYYVIHIIHITGMDK